MAKVIPLKKYKSNPKFKYSLNEQLSQLPRNTAINDVILHLEKEGVSRNEFYADRAIEFGSEKSIPSDRLFIYAAVFDCPVQDIMNQPVKAKSIRQQNLKQSKQKSPLS